MEKKVIIPVPSDIERPAPEGRVTRRNLYTNSAQNKDISAKLQAVVDEVFKGELIYKEFVAFENIEQLHKAFSELMIRFDTRPDHYTKKDYQLLLSVIIGSIGFLQNNGGDVEKTVAEITDKLESVLEDVATTTESITEITSTLADYKAIIDEVVDATSKTLEGANKYTDEAKTDVIGDATTDGDTLGKLEDRIETIVANEKTYSIAKVTEGLGSNIKEAYKLVDEDGTQCGTLIEIDKDDSLVDVVTTTDEKGNKVVKFTYNLSDGTFKEITIDLSAYVTESEYDNGLQVVDHVISVKRDEASEAFLSVSEAGIKLSGIQDAIDTAESNAKTYADNLMSWASF